jgi:hypothetical protein
MPRTDDEDDDESDGGTVFDKTKDVKADLELLGHKFYSDDIRLQAKRQKEKEKEGRGRVPESDNEVDKTPVLP